MSKVKLREKPISGDRSSLFLDIYPSVPHPQTGKLVRKHHLDLFVCDKPENKIQRTHNSETLELSENVQAKRQLDVQAFLYDFVSQLMMKGNFIDFFEGLRDKRTGSNLAGWKSAVGYFKLFAGERIPYIHLNETFSEEYADLLIGAKSLRGNGGQIERNTAVSYFAKCLHTLKDAYKKRLLPVAPGKIIEPISPADTHREFLFLDELKNLGNTKCASDTVKRASLFSVLTDLRFSDIHTLDWS